MRATKLVPYNGKQIMAVIAAIEADGITDPHQIRRVVRWRGVWFITCEVPL